MNFEVSFYPVLFYPRPLSSLPIILLLFYHLSRILQWVSVLPLSLHSTMFLLIQKQKKKNRKNIQHFTFHNVSINTSRLKASKGEDTIFTFHNVSINTNLPQSLTLILACFTFHNVSINTGKEWPQRRWEQCFTFHNVSINTYTDQKYQDAVKDFTFHNVSINTLSARLSVSVHFHLYIPQCFY